MEPLDRVQSMRGYGRSSFASAIPGVLPSRIHVGMNGLWQLLGSLWIVHEARREPGPDLIDRQAEGRVWIYLVDAHGEGLGHRDSRAHCRQRTKARVAGRIQCVGETVCPTQSTHSRSSALPRGKPTHAVRGKVQAMNMRWAIQTEKMQRRSPF
jgi:hypothetical protein